MKILHALGWYFPDSLGGTEIYVRGLAERQRASGHEVEVAAPLPALTQAKRYESEGLAVLRYPIPSSPTRNEVQGRVPARGSEVFRDYLDTSRPDVLHVHTFTTGLGIHELETARELGIKTLATNHLASVGYACQRGTLMRWGEHVCNGVMKESTCAACELQHRGLPKAIAWGVSFAGAMVGSLGSRFPGRAGAAFGMNHLIAHNRARQVRLLELLDRFVVLNKATADVVLNNGGDASKLAINYLGVSHRHYERKPTSRERPTRPPVAFGYLGRFHPVKGIYDLARAATSLPSELAFTLTLCGPADDADGVRVRRSVEDMIDGDERVRIVAAAPPEQVPKVLADFDALCVPSVAFEGGPTVLSEAHAVGTPVIGTRVGAMTELINNGVNGALVDAGDWRALAAVLADVATRPDKTIDAWRAALPGVRTMDDIAADYETLYQQILVERSR